MTSILAAFTLAAFAVQAAPVNPQAAALDDFSKRLNAYLHLREELGRKLKPLEQTTNAIELQARQQALAAALRSARGQAKQGDLVPPEVQRQIRQTVAGDFKRRAPATQRAALEEVPPSGVPGINRNYPERAALATVPPLLLASLPKLPDNLQYRFYGRHIVVLDGDVEIVIDYVENVLPR